MTNSTGRNRQWLLKKRFDFDKITPNKVFDANGQISLQENPYNLNYNKGESNFYMPPTIPLEDKNVTYSLRPEEGADSLDGSERKFILYEVGDPHVWFEAHVQLLEKLSTPEGNSIWNDLTKQDSARISSFTPEWSNQVVNIRYRCSEPIPKEDFTLPSASVYLLLPQNGKFKDGFSDDKLGDFIVVPAEDIEAIEESTVSNKSNGNSSTSGTSNSERHRRVLVRLSRALFGRKEDNFKIFDKESGKYLRIPYRRPYHAQIDLEAKADENQLVYVGRSSARLTTAVSESTRRHRAILTVQVTNTGLAAAHFRPTIRECTPEPLKFNEDDIRAEIKPILIPPLHSHKFCFEIPLEMSGDITHCSNEDPRLLCAEMSEHQQVAAGLSPREGHRQVRATACYPDIVTINLIVIVFGVLLFLLFLGLLKGCLGLLFRCVGSWGIDLMFHTPKKLDHYYERSLRSRQVVYDGDGWPVQPDTMKRTVRLVSKPMEFVLNITFFIILPCLLLWNSLKQIVSRCGNKENADGGSDPKTGSCNSPCDMQDKETRLLWRRRRRRLSRWMSPQAEQLSADIWRNGLATQAYCPSEHMRPLLRKERLGGNNLYRLQSATIDSEQDDTEYVLMQMQNSREALTKSLKHS